MNPNTRLKLQIYLNDHLAGAALGVSVAKRAARNNQGTSLGDFLNELVDELCEDKRDLERVFERLHFSRNRLKQALPWVGEKIGRLKLNGEFRKYSDLSRLEELEAIGIAIYVNRLLWESLGRNLADDDRLSTMDFEAPANRAKNQARRLERFRNKAAEDLLGKAA